MTDSFPYVEIFLRSRNKSIFYLFFNLVFCLSEELNVFFIYLWLLLIQLDRKIKQIHV